MSLIFMDGADDGFHSQKWVATGGNCRDPVNGGRNGTRGYCYTDYNGWRRYNLAPADQHATLTFGCAIQHPNPGADRSWLRFFGDGATGTTQSAGTSHVFLRSDVNGAIHVYRGDPFGANTLLGSSANGTLAPNPAWNYVEFQSTLHDTTGSIIVRVNGNPNPVINLTNIDTKNGGTGAVFDSLVIQGWPGVIDDIYVTNGAGAAPHNSFLGDCRIQTLFPNGNGNYSQFVGSDGNSTDNYLLVDENPDPNTTDYVESGTTGNKDSYAFQDTTLLTIRGVQQASYMAKSNTGFRLARQFVRIAGTDYPSSDLTLPSGYAPFFQIRQLSPASSAAWTTAEINAAEFGIEVR